MGFAVLEGQIFSGTVHEHREDNDMKPIATMAIFLALFLVAPHAAGQDKIYTWIDENGVVRYTNTLPPEGAKIIDSEKEIPHDAEQARQREIEQRRYLKELEAKDAASPPEKTVDRKMEPEKPKQAASEPEEKTEAKQDQDDRNRRNETYHQKQIEKRRAQELRRQKYGSTPAD
jgi:hypothetical protein